MTLGILDSEHRMRVNRRENSRETRNPATTAAIRVFSDREDLPGTPVDHIVPEEYLAAEDRRTAVD